MRCLRLKMKTKPTIRHKMFEVACDSLFLEIGPNCPYEDSPSLCRPFDRFVGRAGPLDRYSDMGSYYSNFVED